MQEVNKNRLRKPFEIEEIAELAADRIHDWATD